MRDLKDNDEMTGLTEHLRRQTAKNQAATSPMHEHHVIVSPKPRFSAGLGPRIFDPVVLRQKQNQKHAKIDRFFLVFFPLMFLVFNCVYWAAYYYAHPVITVQPEQY